MIKGKSMEFLTQVAYGFCFGVGLILANAGMTKFFGMGI